MTLHIHIAERPAREGDEIVAAGTVESVRVSAGEHAYVVVVVTPKGPRDVHLTLPPGCNVPFSAGEAIVVRQSSWIEGIHVINNACITTSTGEPLATLASNGDAHFAPGWSVNVESGPDDRCTVREGFATAVSRGVRLTRRGVSVVARDNTAVHVSIGDETWIVVALAQSWEGVGMFPPDAKTYHRFELVRVV